MDNTVSRKNHKKSKKALEDGAESTQDKEAKLEVVPSISSEEGSTEQVERKKKKKSKKNKKSTEEDGAAGETTVDSVETSEVPQEESADKKKKKSKKRKAAEDTPAASADAPLATETNDSPFPFPSEIVSILKQQGFTQPTEIQAKSWPIALAGKDLIGLAETGSGKTLAFLLPALMHIKKVKAGSESNSKRKKPASMVVVLSPTRELAMQTHKVCEQFQHLGASAVCVYGGMPKHQQFKEIQKGCDIVIATPGRLIDFLEDGSLDLSSCKYVVLDEADRMLDLGFEPQIRRVMSDVPTERHTLMFSATWPSAVEKLANQFLKSPSKVTIGSEQLSGNQMIHQIVEVVEEHEKFPKLLKLLEKWGSNKNDKIIIFMLYKKACERMARQLANKGWHIGELHGDKSQDHRNGVIEDFKKGRVPILVATDVAARGLDVKDVKYVINVEFPLRIEDYVHRIGRTGRAGTSGTSYTFFTKGDKPHSRDLVNVLNQSKQAIDPQLQAMSDTTIAKPKQNSMTKMYGVTSNTLAFDENAKPKRVVFD